MSLYDGIKITGKPDLANVAKLDLLPMPMISRMMQYGMALDRQHFRDLSNRLGVMMRDLKEEICDFIPPEKLDEFTDRIGGLYEDDMPMNVNSRDQLSVLLFEVLGVGSEKRLKTTKAGTRISTGKKQMLALQREHPIIKKCLKYAEVMKLKSTYSAKLPELAVQHRAGTCWCGIKHPVKSWRVHTQILSTRTDTGRYSSKSPNLQNVSVRSELGRQVRSGFTAPEGTVLVGADFSQIEMRIGAHYSNDANLVRIFKEGLDPHTDTAKRAFKTETPDKLTQRDPCKNVNFGVFYGLGGPGLYDLMEVTYETAGLAMPEWLTVKWCEQFIEEWFGLYPGVRDYLDQQHYRARRYGIVWDLFGRIRRVPEVQSCHSRIREAGLRQAGNMPIQATSAELMKLAMAELEPRLKELLDLGVWVWPLMTIHDELIVECEPDYAEYVKILMTDVMSEVMVDKESGVDYCRVPLSASGKISTKWEK